MSRVLCLRVALALAFSILPGCDSSETTGPSRGLSSDLALSPRPNEEAEWAALWLDGALAAPDSTYGRIRDDLASIREDFRESNPVIDSLHFHPWWGTDLEVSFNALGRQQIREGLHREWDDLNEIFGVTEVDTLPWTYGLGQVILSFRKRLHPSHVQNAYLGLQEVSWVGYQPTAAPPPGVIPRRMDTTRAYLFRLRSDDGLSNEYWYFRMVGPDPTFVGYYDGESEEPDWWPEATGR